MKPAAWLAICVFLLSACKAQVVNDQPVTVAEQAFSDFEGLQLSVGQVIPAFTLLDGSGKAFDSQQRILDQPSMLLFYRGDWCPYCISQLEDWQNLLPLLSKYNIQLIAISPDDVATIENTQRRFGQNYIFLSDKDLMVSSLFGVANQKDLPHPSLFLLDQHGKLLWYYASSDYKTRPSVGQVANIIDHFFKQH